MELQRYRQGGSRSPEWALRPTPLIRPPFDKLRVGHLLPQGEKGEAAATLPIPFQNNSSHHPKERRNRFVHHAMMAMMLEQSEEASDQELIGRAGDGDKAAFGQLVERHYDFVYRVAYRWCGRKADAEDIAQEVCARLGRTIRSYRGGAAFTTWLYALTLNAGRDMMRKSAREAVKVQAFGVHMLIGGEAVPEPDGQAERLWAAVRELPDKQRDAVLLVYGEGLSHAAAADAMACAEATVSWHIHEAKKRLKLLTRSAGEV
jgi:RNA polymerase sigma-70 factor, ECF subfamily